MKEKRFTRPVFRAILIYDTKTKAAEVSIRPTNQLTESSSF